LRVCELKSIFGLDIKLAKQGARKYKLTTYMCMLLDALIVITCAMSLFKVGNAVLFLEISTVVAIGINMLAFAIVGGDNREAYIAYSKLRNKGVSEKRYSLDEKALYSVLFCSGYKRIKKNSTADVYKEAINSACMQSLKYSRRILKNLSKYESENGNMTIFTCKGYYIDIKED